MHARLLGAIVFCAFTLRAWGVWFGLPLLSNLYIRPDESLIVAAAARFWDTGGNPSFFAYPALMTEICAILYLPWQVLGDGPASAFGRDPSVLFLVARAVSVVAGSASTLLVYVITRRVAGRSAALIAAALFAFCSLAVRDAHFGVTDTLLVFLLLASMAWPLRSYCHLRDVAVIGAIFGLACSTKYTAILLAPSIALRLVLGGPRTPRLAMRDLVLAGTVCTAVFVLLNPYLFLHIAKASGQVAELFDLFYRVQPGDVAWSPTTAVMQVLRPLRHGPAGYAGLALALLSPFLTRHTAALWPLLLALCSFIGALLPFHHTAPYRYALPMLPFVGILAGCAINRINGLAWKLMLTSVLIAPGAWDGVRMVTILSRPDTRTLAAAWIEQNVPRETPVLLLGPPEAEPQFHETAASIERRIAYVSRLYGPASGEIVSVPYRMMLAATSTSGREIFRGVSPEHIPGSTLLVVIPTSPLQLVTNAVASPTVRDGDNLKAELIPSLAYPGEYEYDESDAFFVPWRTLQGVIRPGPDLRLMLIRK